MSTTRLSRLNQEVIEIKKRIAALERVNQTETLAFGNILLDGPNDRIFVGDADNNIIIDGSTATIIMDKESAASTYHFVRLKIDSEQVGALVFQRYTPSDLVSNVLLRSYEAGVADEAAYNSLEVFEDDLTTRRLFLQIASFIVGSSFSYSTLNYSLSGVTGTFLVKIDDSSGNGYMDIPTRASDPTTNGRRIYYNTTTSKFRVCDGGGWKDL